jgi:hypothetical protein
MQHHNVLKESNGLVLEDVSVTVTPHFANSCGEGKPGESMENPKCARRYTSIHPDRN